MRSDFISRAAAARGASPPSAAFVVARTEASKDGNADSESDREVDRSCSCIVNTDCKGDSTPPRRVVNSADMELGNTSTEAVSANAL